MASKEPSAGPARPRRCGRDFAALVNQQAAANGRPSVGFINPAIYAIGQGSGYTPAFHDITTGNNTNSASPTNFFAVPGYDLCTGWGSPAGSNLINALTTRAAADHSGRGLCLLRPCGRAVQRRAIRILS